jgi:hypothetical protein
MPIARVFVAMLATLPCLPLSAQFYAEYIPANTLELHLRPHTPTHFPSQILKGFVVIALSDTAITINGAQKKWRVGDYQNLAGEDHLDIENNDEHDSNVLLVKIGALQQSLTIETTQLKPKQMLEDASDRNITLIVALSPLTLRDVRNLEHDEGRPWRPALPRNLSLQYGKTAWLVHGMHRLTNQGHANARFLTIEW